MMPQRRWHGARQIVGRSGGLVVSGGYTQTMPCHEDLVRPEAPKALCPGCLREADTEIPFCYCCGMPIGMIATTDPMQRIHATGWMYRRALSDCRSPIILLGMLLIFGPALAFMLFAIANFELPARSVFKGTGILCFAVGLVFYIFHLIICLIIVVRVIKSHLESRKRAHGRCGSCGYNFARRTELRCPKCGTEFEPEYMEMSGDGMPIEDESPSRPEPARTGMHVQPITCAQCDIALPLTGDVGICPNCGTTFNRRERVFDTYGPEAFLEESVVEKPKVEASWAPYRRAIIFSAVSVLSIPTVQFFIRTGAIGADRMPFVIFLFIIAFFEWLRVYGDLGRHEPDDANDDSGDADSAG